MNKLPYNAPEGYASIDRIGNHTRTGVLLALETLLSSGGTFPVRITRPGDSLWRLRLNPHPDGTVPPCIEPAYDAATLPILTGETEKQFELKGGNSILTLSRHPWMFRIADANGRVLLSENPADVDGLGRPFVPPLGIVETGNSIRRIMLSFRLAADEALYGLGEKFTPVNKRGQTIVSWTVDALGSTSERSHKNIPFLLSSREYGILLNTGARITWDLGVRSCQSYTIDVEDDTLDLWIITGTSPAEILQHYADLTGHAPVPPAWSFGLWVSSGGTYRDQQSMEQLVGGLQKHDLPADVVHIDPWWMKWRTYCDFKWDREAFPAIEQFIERLHEQRLHLCLWEHPYISVESELFRLGTERGYFVKRPDGEVYVIQYGLSLAPRPDGIVREATPENSWNAPVAIIDLTNPEAFAWFKDLHREPLRMGVDVFKTDFGEDIPADAVFANGETGATMHNLYPLLYNNAVFSVTQEERGYGLVWARSGTAGNQRYPVCWSGDPAADFASLACTIRGGLSAGLSGIPFWSNDIGAYRGFPSAALYTRWAQFGLLCSHSRMHGDSPREPWIFDRSTSDIVRRFVRLRYRLFPYFYSCAHEASRTGMPVLRAMPLAFPDDPNTQRLDYQYMIGPWLLAAPVYRHDNSCTVYLPAGIWLDFWTHERFEGPRTLHLQVPIDKMPLFVRNGAIIPMMPEADRIPSTIVDPLILEIRGNATSSYSLTDDAGQSSIRFNNDPETGVRIEIASSTARTWKLLLKAVQNTYALKAAPAGTELRNTAGGDCEIILEPAASATVVIRSV